MYVGFVLSHKHKQTSSVEQPPGQSVGLQTASSQVLMEMKIKSSFSFGVTPYSFVNGPYESSSNKSAVSLCGSGYGQMAQLYEDVCASSGTTNIGQFLDQLQA
jgi:hypothetical protein